MATCPQCNANASILKRDLVSGVCSRCRNSAPAVRLGIGSIALIFLAVVFANRITEPSQPASVSSEEIRELRLTVQAQTLMIKKLQFLLDNPLDSPHSDD